MIINLDAEAFQTVTIGIGARLTVVMCDYDAVDHEATAHELVAQAQHIDVVGDTQVATHLVFLDIDSADDDDNLRHIGKLHQHLQLDVRLKTWQNTTCMEVVKQLPAKFQIKLIAKFRDALFNVFRLNLKVFLAIEPVFHCANF